MIYREAVEKVEKFVFLGSIVTATLDDIKQISLASAALERWKEKYRKDIP